ncbi:hypothetical protein [Rhizobium ruizarguesonis]|uniref:hypothetical protein n=1 Tax=Rhizobium ruizarguesonis TaxID=2081791 RepID=UPI0010323CEC|nr:hypothetical protein [Rhizobium ruizarguesonis]TAV04566.1 hypothetical protein ELI39_04295 [Rhizobium ruizarguesonis]
MPDRIVGGRVVPDRRKPLYMEPLQAIAEHALKELYPGVWKRAEADIDQLPRLIYDGVWRDRANEITADVHAFADFHPVDEQRTEPAIKAWSQQCASELDGDYDQEYYRIAVHVGLLAYVRHMRELRDKMTCEAGWHRIVERFHYACRDIVGYCFIGASEKWGMLSLSYRCDSPGAEACRAAETAAIEASLRTCERCGRSGELRLRSWRKTLCDEHSAGWHND